MDNRINREQYFENIKNIDTIETLPSKEDLPSISLEQIREEKARLAEIKKQALEHIQELSVDKPKVKSLKMSAYADIFAIIFTISVLGLVTILTMFLFINGIK